MSEEKKMRIHAGYAAGFVLLSLFVSNIVVDETALAEQERWVRLTAKVIIAVVSTVVFVLILGRIKRS